MEICTILAMLWAAGNSSPRAPAKGKKHEFRRQIVIGKQIFRTSELESIRLTATSVEIAIEPCVLLREVTMLRQYYLCLMIVSMFAGVSERMVWSIITSTFVCRMPFLAAYWWKTESLYSNLAYPTEFNRIWLPFSDLHESCFASICTIIYHW